jgi:uncharacterized protein
MTSLTSRAGAIVLSAIFTVGPAWSQAPAADARAADTTRRGSAAKVSQVALHVDQNDPAVMTLALNNAQNIVTHFKALSKPVRIEIVAYGPGLHMLRDDTSPVKQRISTMAFEEPNITFAACGNTRDNMAKAEGAEVRIMPEARLVPSGVVRLMELQAAGYAYIKP